MGGGLTRCVGCGEVQWSLLGRVVGGGQAGGTCRLCGAELRPERRRPGRRFPAQLAQERRDARPRAIR